MSRVLFVCLQNAGRSQISRALFDRAVADGRHQSRSAGTTPADAVHPEVIAAMDEIGIDLAGERPTELTRDLAEWADIVVTMGCGDACPYIPGKRYVDWNLDDPAGRPLDEVRRVRDQIGERIEGLIAELDPPDGA
ncbi:MAG: arsenate reductase ArsC [Solirubrobacterales bacterium]|nr:arsenate reductase ArsC [Solirubrobacterales bacterium]